MGDLRGHPATQPIAVLLALLLVCAVGWLALTRLPADRQLERWLRAQPGVDTVVLHPTSALAAGPAAAQIPRPGAQVGMSVPLSAEGVTRFMAAYEAFVAEHEALQGWTVDLRHGADAVLVAGPTDNRMVLDVLGALRGRPEVESVRLGLSPFPTSFRAVVRPGSNPVATASDVSARVPTTPERSSVWKHAAIVVQDAAGHEVRVGPGAQPSTRAARAFAEAVRLEGGRRVLLSIRASAPGTAGVAELELDPASPTSRESASALNTLGFGMVGHGEAVSGVPRDGGAFDERAWSARVGALALTVPGVRAASARSARSDDATGLVTKAVLDLRASDGLAWARLAAIVPDEVDRVEVHTQRAAPDYQRYSALPEDPEVVCPRPDDGSTDLAVSGPPSGVGAAAEYVAALRRVAHPTCIHWRAGTDTRSGRNEVFMRIALRPNEWRPVLDLLLARRVSQGTTDVEVLLEPSHAPWTAGLVFGSSSEPYSTTTGAETPAAIKQAQSATVPLLAYWHARLRAG